MQDSVGPAFATRAPHRHADTIFCMASIKTYQRKSGDLSYTVVWRTGGTRAGRWCRETFDDVRQAERFQDLVNGHGQQWPPGWVKGEGFVEASTAPASDAERFPAYAHGYVKLLTDISDHTRTNYIRFIDNHMVPWFGELSVSDRGSRITRDHVSRWILDLQNGRPGPHHPSGTVRRPYAAKTIANLHGLLFSILQSAVDADPRSRLEPWRTHQAAQGERHGRRRGVPRAGGVRRAAGPPTRGRR